MSVPRVAIGQHIDFRIGSILKQTCLVLALNFLKFVGIGTLAAAPSLAVPYAAVLHLPSGVLGLTFLVTILVTLPFGQSAVVLFAFQAVRGRTVSLGEGLKVGLRRFWPVCAIGLFSVLAAGVQASLWARLVNFGSAQVGGTLIFGAYLMTSLT